MMGLINQATSKMYKPRASDEDKVPDDTEPDDTSILSVSLTPSPPPAMRYFTSAPPCDDADDGTSEYRDENEGSIISSLISQLRYVRSSRRLPRNRAHACRPPAADVMRQGGNGSA